MQVRQGLSNELRPDSVTRDTMTGAGTCGTIGKA